MSLIVRLGPCIGSAVPVDDFVVLGFFREAIQQGIERLRNHETGGFSNFLLAFREVSSRLFVLPIE